MLKTLKFLLFLAQNRPFLLRHAFLNCNRNGNRRADHRVLPNKFRRFKVSQNVSKKLNLVNKIAYLLGKMISN